MAAEVSPFDPLTEKLFAELLANKPVFTLTAQRFATWERSLATHPRRRTIATELLGETAKSFKARRTKRALLLCRLATSALGSHALARRTLERLGLQKRSIERLFAELAPASRR